MNFLKKTGKALADVIPGLEKFTFDPNEGTIFVTNGTGVVGHCVALSLLEAGHKYVRVGGVWKKGDGAIGGYMSMGQRIAEELEAKGAEVVDFDWSNEDTHEAAVVGVHTVFCTIPHTMDHWVDVFPAFLRTCKKVKVEHFVKISFFNAGNTNNPYRKNVPFVKFHETCDDILETTIRDSRISYTILAASQIMAIPLIQQGLSIRKAKKFVTASYCHCKTCRNDLEREPLDQNSLGLGRNQWI